MRQKMISSKDGIVSGDFRLKAMLSELTIYTLDCPPFNTVDGFRNPAEKTSLTGMENITYFS